MRTSTTPATCRGSAATASPGRSTAPAGTADLLQVMLPDAAHLQEEEAAFANRHRTSKHDPALPLYTMADADRALAQVRRVGFGERFTPAPGVEARFTPSGHILGAGARHLPDRRSPPRVLRGSRPLRRPDHGGPGSGGGGRRAAGGVHLRQPRPPRRRFLPAPRRGGPPRRRAEGLAAHPGLRGGPLAGDPVRPARPRADAGPSRACRSTSTAPWASRRRSSTPPTPRSTTGSSRRWRRTASGPSRRGA